MIGVLASQNSLMYCRHIPQGLDGVLASVAIAIARMSPVRAPFYHLQVGKSGFRQNDGIHGGSMYLKHSISKGYPFGACSYRI